MSVQERTEMWKQVKDKKIEEIRKQSEGKGTEECTFKPRVNKSSNRNRMKSSTSLNNLQTMNSIQKYVYRMNKIREDKDIRQIQDDQRIGSGK